MEDEAPGRGDARIRARPLGDPHRAGVARPGTGPGGGRVREGARRRPRQSRRPSAWRNLDGSAPKSPRTPPSCSGCRTSTARWSAAPSWMPSRLPRSWRPLSHEPPAPAYPVARRVPRSERPRLVILDGWGLPSPAPATPYRWPTCPCSTSVGRVSPHHADRLWAAVGLPEGQMGNTEVGHLNLGAGAVVRQDLMRIDEAVADGSLARTRSCGLRSPEPGAGPLARARIRRRRAFDRWSTCAR